MIEEDHIGYYECDDEGEENNRGYQEYQEEEQLYYPQSSSNKNSIAGYEQSDHYAPNQPSAFHPQNDPRWLTSEAENISGSSENRNQKILHPNYAENEIRTGNFDNEILNYPNADREKYFSNQDLNIPQNKELLTITVEIGNGQQENIVIMEGEAADEVAGRFWDKYDMNDELRQLFTEQIAQNISQAIEEDEEEEENNDNEVSQNERSDHDPFMNDKFANSDSAQIDHASTALEATPQYNVFSNPVDGKNNNSSTPNIEKHTYSTPGPILINPNRGDKRTLPKQRNGYSKLKGNKSFSTLNDFTPNKPQINSHSALLANRKKVPGGTVYSRLHSEAVQKQKQKTKRNKMSHVSYEASTLIKSGSSGTKSAKKRGRNLFNKTFTERHRTPVNYGEKLYQNGLKKMEERERKANREKIERELKNYESLTFKPQINSVTKKYKRNSKKLEDQLIEKGKKTNEMIERKRSEILFEKQHRYNYKPKINKKSERIIQERSRQFLEESSRIAGSSNMSQNLESSYMTTQNKLNKFSLLYDDAMKRKQRKDEIYSRWLDSEWTFQPDVSKGNTYDSYYVDGSGDFGERLSKPSTLKERSKMRHLQNQCYDKNTGQPLFRPRVGRPPLSKRDFENLPVTEKLYLEGQKMKHIKEEKIKNELHKREYSASRPKIQDKSEELLEQKKARKFHEIFQIIDSDGDGVISAERIDISGLQPDILEIFTPLLWEMEELEHTLDLEEFIDASMRLYDTLKIPEKNLILLMKDKWSTRKNTSDDQYTFQPQLNHNSLKIAAKTREGDSDIADLLMYKRLEAEAKIDAKRRMKNDEELEGWTFQPQIAKSSPYQEAYRIMNVWDNDQELSANIPN